MFKVDTFDSLETEIEIHGNSWQKLFLILPVWRTHVIK